MEGDNKSKIPWKFITGIFVGVIFFKLIFEVLIPLIQGS